MLFRSQDKQIVVIPTKTIPQGITAVFNYVPENSVEENTRAMMEQMELVKTGLITYAVRDTKIDGKEIHQDDIIGLGDEGLLTVGQDIEQAALDSVEALVDDDSELISVYYGEQVEEAKAQELAKAIEEKLPDCDVELNYGGQPIYYYILSVE